MKSINKGVVLFCQDLYTQGVTLIKGFTMSAAPWQYEQMQTGICTITTKAVCC